MKKTIKRIKPFIFDQLAVAQLSQNKELYQKLYEEHEADMYEEIEVEIPDSHVLNSYEEIEYIDTLLNNDLEEHEEGIYAGVSYSNLYEFDFKDKSVTVSLNLIDSYVFFTQYHRVWFSSDLFKKAYIFADYHTGEILQYMGPVDLKDKVVKQFNYHYAINEVLKLSNRNKLEELFNYYY